MKNTNMFTIVNGEHATLINSRSYKGHVIEKVRRRGIEFYTIDKKGYFLYLKWAKTEIDKMDK